MDCFWYDVLKSVISGLCTGLVLVLIGLIVWKYQLRYSKKLDIYIKSIANISQIKWLIDNIRTPIRQVPIEEIYQQHKDLFDVLERNKYEFMVYFGKKYEPDFDCFSTTMFRLRFDENTLNHRKNIEGDEFLQLKDSVYGNQNKPDEITEKMKLSFDRIEKSLKIK